MWGIERDFLGRWDWTQAKGEEVTNAIKGVECGWGGHSRQVGAMDWAVDQVCRSFLALGCVLTCRSDCDRLGRLHKSCLEAGCANIAGNVRRIVRGKLLGGKREAMKEARYVE